MRKNQWTFGYLVAALVAVSSVPPQPAWTDDAMLVCHGVEPWVGLRVWLPATEPDHAGFMRIDAQRAIAQGLATRPLASTIADTAAWLAARDSAHAWKLTLTLTATREAATIGVRDDFRRA